MSRLLLLVLVAIASSQPAFPAPRLLAYFSFDGQSLSETSIADQSGNGSSLTLENGATLRDPSNCKFGQCFATGVSLNSRGSFTPALDFGQFGGSVAFWALVFSVNDFDRILVKARGNMATTFQVSFHNVNFGGNETAANGEPFALWRYKLRANVTDQSTTGSRDFIFEQMSAAPLRATWHHVAVHLGPATAKIYINGVLQQRITHAQTVTYNPDTSLPFVLGNNPDGLGDRKLVGRIDELRFFRNDQADQEISQPFVMNNLMIDPGTPAPTPMFAPAPPTSPVASSLPSTTTTATARTTTTTATAVTTTTTKATATRTPVTTTTSSVIVPMTKTAMPVDTGTTPASSTTTKTAAATSDVSLSGVDSIDDLTTTSTQSQSTVAAQQTPAAASADGALIGGIVGGVVGLLCIVGAIVALVITTRRRSRNNDKDNNNKNNNNNRASNNNAPAGTHYQAFETNSSHYDRVDVSTSVSHRSHYEELHPNEI